MAAKPKKEKPTLEKLEEIWDCLKVTWAKAADHQQIDFKLTARLLASAHLAQDLVTAEREAAWKKDRGIIETMGGMGGSTRK